MPPEFFYQKVCESAPGLDVWAIGIIWFALVQGKLPFYSDNEDDLRKQICSSEPKFDKNIPLSPLSKNLILKMLEKDPEKRLDLMNMMDMDFVRMSEEEFKAAVTAWQEEASKPKPEQKQTDNATSNASGGK